MWRGTLAAPTGSAGCYRCRATGSYTVGLWKSCNALVLGLLLSGAAWTAERININTADAAALEQGLTNVGPVKAQAIVTYRRQHGPFLRVEDLTRVKGIGTATVERNRQRMTVGTRQAPTAAPSRQDVPAPVPRR